MKKVFFLVWIVFFLPALLCAQEKVEAPVWNVGDKWEFTREGPMEVVDIDKNGYVVKFLGGIFLKSLTGTAIFDKSTFNILSLLKGDKRKKYLGARRKILNFPFTIGGKWEHRYSRAYQADEKQTFGGFIDHDFLETFLILGWDTVEVAAGRFKAIKIEYKTRSGSVFLGPVGPESTAWYWYSPDVKYFVKCQHEKTYREGADLLGAREDWELISFKVKK